MDVKKNNNRYIIKDFGKFKIEKQFEVLQCFLGIDDRLLFQYFQFNINTYKIRKENVDFNFELYCTDRLYFYDKQTQKNIDMKVAKILMNLYAINSNTIKNNSNIEQELLSSCKKNHFDDVPKKILSNIKKLVYIEFISCIDKERFEFVNKRRIFKNNLCIRETGMINKLNSKVIWYEPLGKQEVIQSMKKDVFYTCIVINKNSKFEKFLYSLAYVETSTNYDLIVYTKRHNDFENNIIKKISFTIGEAINLS